MVLQLEVKAFGQPREGADPLGPCSDATAGLHLELHEEEVTELVKGLLLKLDTGSEPIEEGR